MRTVFRVSPLLSMLMLTVISIPAADWPDDPSGVIGGFASSREGSFVPGLEFGAEGQRVQTWRDGEVVWTSSPGFVEGAVPSEGLLVVEHPDGFRSAYMGVEPRPDLYDDIDDGQWIGYAGDETWIFIVKDSEMEKIIDPLTLLPTRENLDAPRIDAVEIVSDESTVPLEGGTEIAAGRWSVAMTVSGGDAELAAPVEISLFWVGEQLGLLRFDSLSEEGGRILADAPDPSGYAAVYDEEGRFVFTDLLLNAGKGTLELRVRDETGRVIRRTWNLNIRSL